MMLDGYPVRGDWDATLLFQQGKERGVGRSAEERERDRAEMNLTRIRGWRGGKSPSPARGVHNGTDAVARPDDTKAAIGDIVQRTLRAGELDVVLGQQGHVDAADGRDEMGLDTQRVLPVVLRGHRIGDEGNRGAGVIPREHNHASLPSATWKPAHGATAAGRGVGLEDHRVLIGFGLDGAQKSVKASKHSHATAATAAATAAAAADPAPSAATPVASTPTPTPAAAAHG